MDGLASLCKLIELEYSRSSIKNEKQCLKQCLKVRSCHGCLEKFPICSSSCRADQVQTKANSDLLSIVSSLRLWDNTFTVFSTDNGGQPMFGGYNWPLKGGKHTLWEGGVRGTALVHGKMLENAGVKCKGLLHITDFFPTLINLAGK